MRRCQRGEADPRHARQAGLEGGSAAPRGRQPGAPKRGAWLTTTANLWGSLALDKFAAKFEAEKVGGRSYGPARAAPQALDWSAVGPRRADQGCPADGSKARFPPMQPRTHQQTLADGAEPRRHPAAAPLRAGYAINRSVSAVEQKGRRWSRGDVMRVRLEIVAQSDMSLGGGERSGARRRNRCSAPAWGAIQRWPRAARSVRRGWLAYEERSFEACAPTTSTCRAASMRDRASLRLNNSPGRFALPPTRVEAMYAPGFGEAPNAAEVAP